MDRKSIIELSNFSIHYLKKLLANVQDYLIYEKQTEGINSAGWVLGHLCAEATDLFNLYLPDIRIDYPWLMQFHNSSPPLQITKDLPTKNEMILVFNEFYAALQKIYLELNESELEKPCPGVILPKHLSNLAGSFHHHLTTHIFVHSGNLVVWKKLMKLPVGGY